MNLSLSLESFYVRIHLDSTMCLLDDGLCGPLQTHTYEVSLRFYLFNKHNCCNVPTYIYGVEQPASSEG